MPLAVNPDVEPKFEDIPNRTESPEHGVPNALKRYLVSSSGNGVGGDDGKEKPEVAFLTSTVMEVQKHATTTKLLIKLQVGVCPQS